MNNVELTKLFLRNKYANRLTDGGEEIRKVSGMFLEDFIEITRALLNVEAISLFVVKEKEEEIYPITSVGACIEDLSKITIKFGIGVVGHTAKEKTYLISNNPENDVRFNKGFDRKTGFRTKNIFSYPIIVDEKIIGIIELINKTVGNFEDTDLSAIKDLVEDIDIKSLLSLAIQHNPS